MLVFWLDNIFWVFGSIGFAWCLFWDSVGLPKGTPGQLEWESMDMCLQWMA